MARVGQWVVWSRLRGGRFGGRGWILLVVLVGVSTGLRAWAARQVPVPWIAPDEMIYGLLGRSLYRSGTLVILGGPTPFYSLVVPAFVGAPLSLGSLQFGYGLLKIVQALLMSLTAVPVYLWARSLVRLRWALTAAGLTLAAPALVYAGLVMSEVVFYPVFVLAAWAMARALERPTLRRQALLVALLVAALATRLQAVVLVPAFVSALALDAILGRSADSLRRFLPTLLGVVVAGAAWLGWRLSAGQPLLGGYGVVTHGSYTIGGAARFVLYHAGSLIILVGVLPACALLLLLFEGLRRGEPASRARAYLAVATSLTAWMIVEVGLFASRYVGRLAERDLIGLAPVLFIGFVLWLERGGGRRYWPMSLAGILVAAPLVTLPLKRLVTSYAPPDAPSLVPLYNLLRATSITTAELVFYCVAAAAILAFALVPRRWLATLPLLLAAALAAGSVAASRYAADQATLRQQAFLGPDPSWIDHTANEPVVYLYQAGVDWTGVWETIFWNQRIERVYDLGHAHLFGPMPQQPASIQPDGRIRGPGGHPLMVRYLVTATGAVASEPTLAFYGRPIAENAQPGNQQQTLALWRTKPPLRLLYRTSGLKPNGDIYPGGDGRIHAYACNDRLYRVTLLIKQAQTITILRNGNVYKRLSFAAPTPDQPWRATIPAAPRPGQKTGASDCTLDIRPSGLIGTTVFQTDP